MSKKNSNSDNSFKIRWESSDVKRETIKKIVSIKGNISINQYIKNLIKRDLAREKGIGISVLKEQIDDIDTKLNAIIDLNKISEAELRLFYYTWASIVSVDLNKVYSQIDLNGRHDIPLVVKKLIG